MFDWLKNKFSLSKTNVEGHYLVRYMPERYHPYVVVNSQDQDFLMAQFKDRKQADLFVEAYNAQAKRRRSDKK
jgi:hypothetical protein